MKKVQARVFDGYVRPDQSDATQLTQRQRQVNSALQQLGVSVKQHRDLELQEMADESQLLRETQGNDAAGKIKHALDYARLDENKKLTIEQLESSPQFLEAEKSLSKIQDSRVRENLRARFAESKTGVLQAQGAKVRAEQKRHEENLQSMAVDAKIRQATAFMSQVENRFKGPKEFAQSPEVAGALEAIKEIPDKFLRETLQSKFANAQEQVIMKHQAAVKDEENMGNYAAIAADTLLNDHTPDDVNWTINLHKELLGERAVTEMARMAISSDSKVAVEALIERSTKQEDVPPGTVAQLMAAKKRIEAAEAKAAKADKTQMHFDLKQARAADSREDQLLGLTDAFYKHEDKMSDETKAGVLSDVKILTEELESEQFVEQALGIVSTREMARGLPGELRDLKLADIKKIQDRVFTDAVNNNDLATVADMVKDPTDLPAAAKGYFGTFMSSVSTANPDEIGDNIAKQYDIARTLEAELGPTKMSILLGAKEYAAYQVVSGIAAHEGLGTAVARFQAYQQATAKGKPELPEDFAETKRTIISEVISTIEDAPWTFTDYDVSETDVKAALAPYFKMWGALGVDKSQMQSEAERIIQNSSWKGMVGGSAIRDAFEVIVEGENGNPYDEDIDDLFELATEEAFKKHHALQEGLEGLTVHAIPHKPDFIELRDKSNIPVMKGIMPLSTFADFAKSKLKTRKQKIIEQSN